MDHSPCGQSGDHKSCPQGAQHAELEPQPVRRLTPPQPGQGARDDDSETNARIDPGPGLSGLPAGQLRQTPTTGADQNPGAKNTAQYPKNYPTPAQSDDPEIRTLSKRNAIQPADPEGGQHNADEGDLEAEHRAERKAPRR